VSEPINNKHLKIGILTGGGDCSGLNATIRSVAKSLILNCKAEIVGIQDGFLGFIERRSRALHYDDLSGILSQGGTLLGSSNRGSPFDYNSKDLSQEVMDYYNQLGLDGLVVIGGDGSLTIAYEMSKLGMQIVGIPKTIDNDLNGSDYTLGFNSAITIVTDALDRLHTTGQSHKRVMILETMGRYAGWIALHSGIAGGADIILLPEFSYDIQEVADACKRRMGERQCAIIVVAEGAAETGGDLTIQQTVTNSPDARRLGGIANVLKAQLEAELDSEIRATQLGHIQRGGSPTAFDRIFATNLGCYAASLVAHKEFGQAVVSKNNSLTTVPLHQVAHKTRQVTVDDPALASALSLGISFGSLELTNQLVRAAD
jgi:6-phosphofructokinase 1